VSQEQIVLFQSFRASPERVWDALTDHEGMGKWSGADVRVVARGDERGVGTVRRLKLGTLRIDEEVVYADAPRRLVYRIVRGLPLSFHRGEILVEPRGETTEVTWKILLRSPVPGLAEGASMLLRPAMTRGLGELKGLIGA
jgi:uncharacterized protein YndB with AHSA1/START domain